MYKLSRILYGLLFIISATTTPTNASNEDVSDLNSLLRVSSNLYEKMHGKEAATLHKATEAPRAPEASESQVLSNNNAPKDDDALQADPLLEVATNAEKQEILEYLFLKENRDVPALRQLSPRIKIKPILLLLRALDQNKQMTAAQIAGKVKVEGTSYKLCSRSKEKGFIQYDADTGMYSMTPKGKFLLENIEAVYQPSKAGRRKKQVEEEEEDDNEDKHQKKASAPAPSKKQRSSEISDSDEVSIPNFKRPLVHHALLVAMGTSGRYKHAEAIYDVMGDNQPSDSWDKCKDNFIHYYLKEHVKHGWLMTKTGKDQEEYALTPKGIKARDALAESIEADEESSLSSSDEPKKRDRSESSSSSSSSSDEEDDEPAKKPVSAKPSPAKKIKPAADLNPQPPAPVAQQPVLTLDNYPEALRNHLLEQIMQAPATDAYLNGIQETMLDTISKQLGQTLLNKFETAPGNVLKEYLRAHLTITIRKNN